MAQPSYPCPRCSGGLTWLAQDSKWYCEGCSAYPYDAPTSSAQGSTSTTASSSSSSGTAPKCSSCQGDLAYIAQYKAWYCYACQKYGAVADPKHALAKCPTCSAQLSYSTDQQRWYCYTCKKYVGQEKAEDAKTSAATQSSVDAENQVIAALKPHSSGGTEASPVQITIINSPSASISAPPPHPQPIPVKDYEVVREAEPPPPVALVEAKQPPEAEQPRVEVSAPVTAKDPTPPADSPKDPTSTPELHQRPTAASPSPFAAPGSASRPAAPQPSAAPASSPTRQSSTTADFMGELRRSKIPRKESPPATAALAPEVRRETVIEDVFLLYNDGRLIRHYTRRLKPTVDSEILSSMLVAVSAFVKDSRLSEEEGEAAGLDEIKYGALRIHLARGKYLTVAMLIQGDDAEGLVGKARSKIKEIETLQEPVVKDWDGKVSAMQPVHKHIEALFG